MANKKKQQEILNVNCKYFWFVRLTLKYVCLFSGWGFGGRKRLALLTLWKWYCMCKYWNDSSSTGSPAMLKTITVNYIFNSSEFKLLPCSTVVFTLHNHSLRSTEPLPRLVPKHILSIFCCFQALLWLNGFFCAKFAMAVSALPFHFTFWLVWMESQNLGSNNLIFSPYSDVPFFVVVALKICIQSRSLTDLNSTWSTCQFCI